MTVLGFILAPVLCGIAAMSSYLYLLYVESLRFRPRESARSYAFFNESIRPLLKFEPEDGLRRFAVARQAALILLSLDILVLTLRGQAVTLALLEATVLSFAALALFVHVVPSVLFSRTTGAWAARLVFPVRLIGWAVYPLIVVTGFVSSLAELSAEEPPSEAKPSTPSDHIEALLVAGQEEGLIGEEDRKLIQSVVEFGDKTVREAMTPRPQIVAIDADRSVEDLRRLFIEREYSRIPAYEETIDNIVGFVHSRDTLEVSSERGRQMRVRELLRPLPLVPDTKPIHDLLREMQEGNHQMSIVIDEYGHTAGLATMEDLMEEIVGEIRDESEPEPDVVEQEDHSFVVAGDLDLDRLEELVDFRPADDFESTTIGGMVCEQLGQVPAPGAKVTLDGIQIEVLAADERRVSSLRVRRIESVDSPERMPPSPKQQQDSRKGAA